MKPIEMKPIEFDLTEEQFELVKKVFDKVNSEAKAGRLGMFIAQIQAYVWKDEEEVKTSELEDDSIIEDYAGAYVRCGFVERERADQIAAVMRGTKYSNNKKEIKEESKKLFRAIDL